MHICRKYWFTFLGQVMPLLNLEIYWLCVSDYNWYLVMIFCPIAHHLCMALPFVMCSIVKQYVGAWVCELAHSFFHWINGMWIVNFRLLHPRSPRGCSQNYPNWPILKILLLYFNTWKINRIHSYVDQEALYQNCKFHDPWSKGSDSRAGSKWSYSFNAFSV